MCETPFPTDYPQFFTQLKNRIRATQVRAALAVNAEMVQLYWHIGRDILQQQHRQGWGAKVIEQLALDLRAAFPDMTGLSARNLKYMRAFAAAWPEEAIVQQAAAQIPWFRLCVLLDKVKDPAEREWYVRQTIENGWSRNVLVAQVESYSLARCQSHTAQYGFAVAPRHLVSAGFIQLTWAARPACAV